MPVTGIGPTTTGAVAALVSALNAAAAATTAATAAVSSAVASLTAATTSSLQKASNLSDVASASTARTNLGLASVATMTPAALAANSAFTSAYATTYLAAGTASATRPLISKLRRGVASANVLVAGDSTGNETTEWVYLAFQALGARFPAYTVNYYLWDATGGVSYSSADVIQTGTGSQTLNVYNLSVTGTTPYYAVGSRWSAAVGATIPDLIMVSYGHNTGDPFGGGGTTEQKLLNNFRSYVMSFIEEAQGRFPTAGILFVAQNPSFISGRETWQATKAQVLDQYAAQRGFGFADVHQAFADAAAAQGSSAFQAAYMTDTTHPNALGQSTYWTPIIDAALRAETSSSAPAPSRPALWTHPGRNLAPNYDFSAWSGAAPDGWTLTGATTTKDTSIFETGTYSCRFDVPSGAGTMNLVVAQTLASSGLKGVLDGQLVTLAARVYIPSGGSITPSIIVADNTGSTNQARTDGEITNMTDRWCWMFATKRMGATPTSMTLSLYPRLSGTAAGTVYIDRVYATVGAFPYAGMSA